MTLLSRTAVIVVNYGSPALLRANLEPLQVSAPEITVVVVDNFSTDAARTEVTALATANGWLSVLPEANLGFGAGMNLGVAAAMEAGLDLVLLLNPDASITPESIERLAVRAVAAPLTLFAPRILRPDGTVWFDGADLYLSDGRIRSRNRRSDFPGAEIEPWLTGACLLLSVELWERVGGFLDDYFLYWEDVDLSHRVVASGGALERVEDAIAVHDEGGTHDRSDAASARAKSSTYYYFNIRNRLVFAARHLSPADVRRWRRSAIPVAWGVLLQGGRRQLLTSTAPLRAGFAGVRDGLRLSRAASRGR